MISSRAGHARFCVAAAADRVTDHVGAQAVQCYWTVDAAAWSDSPVVTSGPGRGLRVAVVGSGPSGIYAADALTAQEDTAVSVDILDRLPCPFGLVRYGVAPDHLSIRSVRGTLDRVLRRPAVRFLGNVEIGTDLSLAELHRCYDAIVFGYGAARDRHLGIPGEDLPGSIAATDLVAWYCGHPDAPRAMIEESLRSARSVVVVGVGNVAVDVTRILTKPVRDLDQTDMPEHVLTALRALAVTDVHVLGRRGPVQASFTTKELRELGELGGVAARVDPADLELDAFSQAQLAGERVAARNLDVLAGWTEPPAQPAGRTIRLHFLTRPVAIRGTDRCEQVDVERTRIDDTGAATGTGEIASIAADLVVRSVGYRGQPLGELPYDAGRGIVPNDSGRVLREGAVVGGEYVVGWIKRGPTGIIGTNKKDAVQTVAALLADAATLAPAATPSPDAVTDLLRAHGVDYVPFTGWERIDAAEVALGASLGRPRTTLHERAQLLAIAHDRATHG